MLPVQYFLMKLMQYFLKDLKMNMNKVEKLINELKRQSDSLGRLVILSQIIKEIQILIKQEKGKL